MLALSCRMKMDDLVPRALGFCPRLQTLDKLLVVTGLVRNGVVRTGEPAPAMCR